MNVLKHSVLMSLVAYGLCTLHLQDRPDGGLLIKDSKGRPRILSAEKGDKFGIALLDQTGKQRLLLLVDEVGDPSIQLYSAEGKAQAFMITNGDSSTVGVADKKGASRAALVTKEEEQAMLAIGDEHALVEAYARKKSDEIGIAFRRDGHTRDLWASLGGSSNLWLGMNDQKADDDQGIHLGCGAGRAAILDMRQGESKRIVVSTSEKYGAGFGVIGADKEPLAKFGVDSSGKASLGMTNTKSFRVQGADDAVFLEYPKPEKAK